MPNEQLSALTCGKPFKGFPGSKYSEGNTHSLPLGSFWDCQACPRLHRLVGYLPAGGAVGSQTNNLCFLNQVSKPLSKLCMVQLVEPLAGGFNQLVETTS